MEPDTNVHSSEPSSDQGEGRQTSDEQTIDGGARGPRSRKKTKHGRYISDITVEEVKRYTHLPAHVACERLGLGLTSFKRVCRSLGINSWPYRKDSSSAPPDSSGNNTRFGGGGGGAFMRQQSLNSAEQQLPPPPVPAFPQPLAPAAPQNESPLQALLREATPDSLLALLEKVRELSRDMKQTLGLSVIDDNAVDLLHYVLTRLKEAQQMEQQQAAAMAAAAADNPIAMLAALAQTMLNASNGGASRAENANNRQQQ